MLAPVWGNRRGLAIGCGLCPQYGDLDPYWMALAAVDEAIYMVREDDTPEIYSFFHPARPAALAYAKFGAFEYDGETHKIEKLPEGEHFRTAKRVGRRLFRNPGVYDTMGVGSGDLIEAMRETERRKNTPSASETSV